MWIRIWMYIYVYIYACIYMLPDVYHICISMLGQSLWKYVSAHVFIVMWPSCLVTYRSIHRYECRVIYPYNTCIYDYTYIVTQYRGSVTRIMCTFCMYLHIQNDVILQLVQCQRCMIWIMPRSVIAIAHGKLCSQADTLWHCTCYMYQRMMYRVAAPQNVGSVHM